MRDGIQGQSTILIGRRVSKTVRSVGMCPFMHGNRNQDANDVGGTEKLHTDEDTRYKTQETNKIQKLLNLKNIEVCLDLGILYLGISLSKEQ